MAVVTRFAPSPTGLLHVGNIRTCVHNWLLARRAGADGAFWLRIDDTDAARSEERFVDAIIADLDWLGMAPVGIVRQSGRSADHDAAFARLRDQGRVYPCYETPEELDLRRKVLAARGLPPIYDRPGPAAPVPEGIAPHWRFRLDHGAAIAWVDGVRGAQRFDPARLSDPVIRRADDSWLYLLPSVIDDIAMGITDVVRGEDHVTNTAVQIQMFEALGAVPPRFAHTALLTGADGKLSKRLGATGTAALRDAGIEPAAIIAFLARLGTSDPVEPITDADALAGTLDFSRFGRAPARHDPDELAQLNARIVHNLPYEAVADRLPAAIDSARWEAVRGNCTTVAAAGDWAAVFEGDLPVTPATDDGERAVVGAAADAAGALALWDADAWPALTSAARAATGARGRALFHPLRRALTGRDDGPDMASIVPLIARPEALRRLRVAAGG